MDHILSFHTVGSLPSLFLTSALCHSFPLFPSSLFPFCLENRDSVPSWGIHSPTPHGMAAPLPRAKASTGQELWLSHCSLLPHATLLYNLDQFTQKSPAPAWLGEKAQSTSALNKHLPSPWKKGSGQPFSIWFCLALGLWHDLVPFLPV